MTKFRFLLAATVASVALTGGLVAPVAAQQITSSVQGRVTDDQGAPVANATVVVTDTRTSAARTVTTGGDGRFSTSGLVTGGPYSITATADGYEGQTVEDVTITLQGATSVTFALTASATEDVIVVTAVQANVTQLAVGPGTSFGAAILESAPSFNRDVRDIIRIDPRVSLDRDDGGSGQDRISCLGGNDRGNAFTVDGIGQGDIYGLNDTGMASRSSTPIPYAAVRETQVQFAPFDVDFGQFTGCAINVVTRGGTNSFSGGGFFEYSNSKLRGTRVADRNVAPIEPEKRWGLSIGGPIIPDKLFFFGAFESHEAGQSQDDGPAGAGYPNELAGVPVAAFNEISQVLRDVYGVDTGPLVRNRPFKNKRYFARVDWNINDDHRLEGTYQHLEESTLRPDDFFTGATSPGVVGLNTFYLSGTKSDYYSARLYSQWSDMVSTELRYSRSKIQDLQDPFGGGEAQLGSPIPAIIVGIDNPTGTPDGTVKAGPGFSRSANDLRTSIDQYRAVVNVDFGAHRVKLGVELNHADLYNLFVQNATGTLVFRNINDLREGLLSPGTGSNQTSTTPANVVSGATEGAFGNFSFSGDINDAAAAFTRDIYSVFIQDEWDVTDRLNAVIGGRLDWYDGGHPNPNINYFRRYGFYNTTGFSNIDPIFLPRLGFTYDAGDFAVLERTKLHGGVGIFSGGDPLVWFGNAFQNNGIGNAGASTQDAPCPSGQIDVVVNGVFTGVPTCFQAAAQAIAAAAGGDTQSISPDIKMPTVFRANFGLSSKLNFMDDGFFSNWDLNLDYIYSEYQNPFTLVDLSQFPDPRIGLSGYAIDGRPVYRSLEPTRAGCTGVQLIGLNPGPVYSGVTTSNAAACFGTSRDDELMLTNTDPYRSHVASIILSKNFRSGVFTEGGSTFMSLGYSYTDAHDRRSMYNSTAGSNYDLVASSNRQNPPATRGFYASAHNISLQTTFREKFVDDLTTTLGITFVARAGRPYSLTFTGVTQFDDSTSGSDNALLYVPTGPTDPNVVYVDTLSSSGAVTKTASQIASELDSLISGLPCANKYRGKTIPRNTCTNDWYFDLDLSVSQELPGPGSFFGLKDTIKVYAMFDNFLNFLDRNWNVQRRRNFAGVQDIATAGRAAVTSGATTPALNPVDSQGRYVISAVESLATINSDNQINTSSSVWRLKFGISYDF